MLGSPKAIGKFQRAIAMSNLGGGVNLGLSGDYATTYSAYLTIKDGFSKYGGLFSEAGCNQTAVADQIACLKSVNATSLVNQPTVARYVVQDGVYVNTHELILTGPNNNTAHVPVIFGISANDGASFSKYPKSPVVSEVAGIMAGLGISDSYAQSIINSGLFPYYDTGNVTLDSFNVSQRVATDNQFRCIDQATMYAGAVNKAFAAGYYYQLDRTIGGYDPNGLGGAPVTPGYRFGNPNLPYFRLHGGDTSWMFGNLHTLRDPADLYTTQLSVGYFTEFIRSGQPNPSEEYLNARGYDTMLDNVRKYGPWEKIAGLDGPIRILDYPSVSSDFIDKPQCAFLNYSITFFAQ
jgi:carboxylesterase type B